MASKSVQRRSPTSVCHTLGNVSCPGRPDGAFFKMMACPLLIRMSPQEQSRASGTPLGESRVPRFWKPGLPSPGVGGRTPDGSVLGPPWEGTVTCSWLQPARRSVTACPCPGPPLESPPLARGSRASTHRQPWWHEAGLLHLCRAPGEMTQFVPKRPSSSLIWFSAFAEPYDAVFPESDFPC